MFSMTFYKASDNLVKFSFELNEYSFPMFIMLLFQSHSEISSNFPR